MNKARRIHSSQFKTRLVLEYLKGIKTQAEICRENTISQSLFAKWVRQFEENVYSVFEGRGSNKEAEKMAKLERVIGKQAIEIDFLKRGLGMS